MTLTLLVASIVLLSMQPQASQPATRPATKPDILGGPAVVEKPSRPSIVKRSFDGILEDLGAEADVAAVAALNLAAEQRATVEEALADRHAAFDAAVRENYGLVVELAALQAEDDPQKRFDLVSRARTAFEPFFIRGTFIDEVESHLTGDQLDDFTRMFNEYREAKLAEIQKKHGGTRRNAIGRARVEALGQMIRESIERQVGLERAEFERLADDLDLTQEQQAKAEAIFGPLAVKRLQNIKPSAAERHEAIVRFNTLLTKDQRRKLVELWMKQLPHAPASQPASQPARR